MIKIEAIWKKKMLQKLKVTIEEIKPKEIASEIINVA